MGGGKEWKGEIGGDIEDVWEGNRILYNVIMIVVGGLPRRLWIWSDYFASERGSGEFAWGTG